MFAFFYCEEYTYLLNLFKLYVIFHCIFLLIFLVNMYKNKHSKLCLSQANNLAKPDVKVVTE